MAEASAVSQQQVLDADSADYTRFIILCLGRTGSNMLAQALNSSPHITCFGDVFNPQSDFIQVFVGSQEVFSPHDLSLRREDPVRFLEERIFCRYPQHIRAVGFKLHYGQFGRYPGLGERLLRDRNMCLIHLCRHNLLRTLVSLRLAQATGVYLKDTRRKGARARLAKAARHPLKTARSLARCLRRASPRGTVAGSRVSISPQELFASLSPRGSALRSTMSSSGNIPGSTCSTKISLSSDKTS